MKQKSELSRLAEENERISDQLATYVERPRTEGQEANGNANANSQNGHNGDHFKNNEKKHQEEEQVWHKKYLAMSQEHEQILKEKDVIMQNFSSVESQYKTQVSKLEADLEDQRAKNNVSFFYKIILFEIFIFCPWSQLWSPENLVSIFLCEKLVKMLWVWTS